jgi:hypothetical protein
MLGDSMSISTQTYKDAILTQDAVNASGLVKSLAVVVDEIWKEAREQGKGTDYVNRHPIMVLYITQLMHLAGMGPSDMDSYANAFEKVSKHAAHEKRYPPPPCQGAGSEKPLEERINHKVAQLRTALLTLRR